MPDAEFGKDFGKDISVIEDMAITRCQVLSQA